MPSSLKFYHILVSEISGSPDNILAFPHFPYSHKVTSLDPESSDRILKNYLFHKHLSKVLLPLLIVSGIRVIGLTIVSEASLAFVGLINPTQKSMGIMINRALNFSGIYYTNFWTWWMIPPIVVLVWMTFLLRELSMTVEEASQKG